MIGRYVQIDARPRAGAPARELADLGVSREWQTIAHAEDDPDAIAAQLKEIRAVAPSQLYETRIGRRSKNPPAHLHVPETVAQLGIVLDLTTTCGSRRTLWEASDVGGLIMACDADAMQRPAGTAALYLLRTKRRNPSTLAAALDQVWGALNSRDGAALLRAIDEGDPDAVIALRIKTWDHHTPTQPDREAWTFLETEARWNERQGNPKQAIQVERVHVNRQGYDAQGRYFGVGDPLYLVTDTTEPPDNIYSDRGRALYVRAQSAKDARARAIAEWGKRHKNATAQDDAAQTYEKWHEREALHVTDADGLPNVIGVFIGHALRIGYRSDKWHERGQFEDYDHDYTERKYEAPEVWADRADLAQASAIVIVGGNQRITPQGID